MILVSSCLIGLNCRYDGTANYSEKVVEYLEGKDWMPVCPEQMGGLKTPRDPAEIRNGHVVTGSGLDVTDEFKKGASEVLKIAKMTNADLAILKERSPSCGSTCIYNGTFTKTLIEGAGITALVLIDSGMKVVSEETLDRIK